MCGRFTSSQRRDAIAERFQVTVPEAYEERYNLAPTQRALIVRERDGEREAVLARWGLLPHWAKDARVAFKMINARAETLAEKPAFRSLLGKHRCLSSPTASTSGAWAPMGRRSRSTSSSPTATRSRCRPVDVPADEETEELFESCTIMTTRPNELSARCTTGCR